MIRAMILAVGLSPISALANEDVDCAAQRARFDNHKEASVSILAVKDAFMARDGSDEKGSALNLATKALARAAFELELQAKMPLEALAASEECQNMLPDDLLPDYEPIQSSD
ncbi:MAG: hypothetical protein ACR2Q4_14470 [Geminicoccaceae bacterium]